ncbi:hypothetical protein [Paenibacillus flagellatus]|uniref:Lipoprotein n=1 Tax=Paenibacillus flagellatus TaxID=2211139 RepID=A0A2V5K9Z5_9BACL|nr:hypothetical protein [Paenibacillus flagellatus]PYI50640.1 hypothetical protein DLM86_28115 [Paenibacillus flagellatus]
MNRWATAVAAALLALTMAGCRQSNYRMQEQQKPDQDQRGMKDERYLENRVNTNIPQGGTSPEDDYKAQQNIRPGDANGGNPPTRQDDNIVEPNSMRQIHH